MPDIDRTVWTTSDSLGQPRTMCMQKDNVH
jgi:hypothetical protein